MLARTREKEGRLNVTHRFARKCYVAQTGDMLRHCDVELDVADKLLLVCFEGCQGFCLQDCLLHAT